MTRTADSAVNDTSWNTREDVHIRLVRPDEYRAAAEVTLAAYAHDYDLRPDYAANIVEVEERATQHQLWVAVDRASGDIVGTVTAPRPGENLYELGRPDELDFRLLGVSPTARGRGIGTVLVRHMLELARQRGLRAVVMNSGPDMVGAHRLYRQLGFQRARDREGVIVSDGVEIPILTFTRDRDDSSGRPEYAEWLDWHRGVEANRRDPAGFLAISGLHWLTDEPERFPHAPGVWSTSGGRVSALLAEGEWVVVDGDRATGALQLPALPERGGKLLETSTGLVEVAKRGGWYVLRPRDPDAPLLHTYAGTDVFPFDPAWRVSGRFVADAQQASIASASEKIQHSYSSPGLVVFEHDGEEVRLRVLENESGGSGFVLFRDAGAGEWTAGAVRSVQVSRVAGTDGVVIDFNRTANLPCTYTEHATCPLPPAENILGFTVAAGEQNPLVAP